MIHLYPFCLPYKWSWDACFLLLYSVWQSLGPSDGTANGILLFYGWWPHLHICTSLLHAFRLADTWCDQCPIIMILYKTHSLYPCSAPFGRNTNKINTLSTEARNTKLSKAELLILCYSVLGWSADSGPQLIRLGWWSHPVSQTGSVPFLQAVLLLQFSSWSWDMKRLEGATLGLSTWIPFLDKWNMALLYSPQIFLLIFFLSWYIFPPVKTFLLA